MRKFTLLILGTLFSVFTFGQTVLISPTGDGGFESGVDFAANGWTVVNHTTNMWYVGSTVFHNGIRGAYVSNDGGTTNAYTNTTSQTSHFYRDVTIPVGETAITLGFSWLGNGETTWDRLLVYTAPTTVTPVAGTPVSNSTTLTGATLVGMYNLQASWQSALVNLPGGLAGTSFRLIFTWQNDGSGGTNPPTALDEISLVSRVPVPLNGTYTIDNTLPLSFPMVPGGNFPSFSSAANYMASDGIAGPVTFNVTAGQVFVEEVPAFVVTGTLTNQIKFNKNGVGANPVISSTGGTGTTDAGITLNGVDYYTFDGIDIQVASGSALEYGYYLRNFSATDGAQNNTIKNCKIILNRASTSTRAIYSNVAVTPTNLTGSNSYNSYRNNVIENSYAGIYLTGNATYPDVNTLVFSNVVGAATPNDIGNGTSACNGIRVTSQSSIVIDANTVRNVSTTGATVYGIYMESGQGINQISNNRVYSIGTSSTGTTNLVYGIRTDINSSFTANVFNNMVSDLNHGVVTASATQVIRAIAVGISGTGTGNFSYNSVLLQEDAAASCTDFYINGGTALLKNNIFANLSTAGATSKRYCIYRNGGTLNSNFNDLYIDGAGTNNFIGFYTADQATLVAWQSVAGTPDLNSISVNPTFTSLTDLHTTNSALNGVGTPVGGITTDIDGDLRDVTNPDLGADENLAAPAYTCTTPAPGNTIITPAGICFGQNVSVSLQNATMGTGVNYQWQSSIDGITYTDISGANGSIYNTNPTSALYFLCNVTCLNGPETVASTAAQVSFANSITSTTPGTRCGTGSVVLTATGSAGTTLNWYDAATAGNFVGTGSPFNTPSISATTTFYVGAETFAPANLTIGNGTLSGLAAPYSPFNGGYGGEKAQYLFKASELVASGLTAGNITGLSIYVTIAGTTYNGFNLEVGNTTLADFTSTANIQAGLTTVYTAASLTPIVGVNNISFSTPFVWDGISNIIVSTSWSNANASNASSTVSYDPTTNYSSQSYRKDNETAANLFAFTGSVGAGTFSFSTSQNRPKITFQGMGACSSPRVAVNATVSSADPLTITAGQTVCNNDVATIAVTSTLASYDSYVWTPATDLYTDLACTTPYVSGASATTVYLKSTTAGALLLTCTSNNSSTQCSNVATSTITILPSVVNITASPSEICVSGTSNVTALPATGYGNATFQWQYSIDGTNFSDIIGATSLNLTTPTLTQTTWGKLIVSLGATTCVESNVQMITVNNPQVLTSTPASRCGTGSVDLTATGSAGATLNWYDVATGGVSLGTGTTFTSPVISSTTPYYVEASIGLTNTFGGRLAPTGTSVTTASNYGLVFNAYNDFVLNSVEVYATVAGNVVVQLQDNLGTILQTATVPVVAGTTTTPQTLTLNFNVPTGTGLRLIAVSSPSMVRESSLGGYPYLLGTNGSITSGYIGGTSSTYYYFYNWSMTTGCFSSRTLVNATVTTPPTISVTSTPATICQGENSTLEATSSNSGYSYDWSPTTSPATGASVTATPATTTTYTVTASDNSGGANDGCVTTATINVNVNPIPSTITVTPATQSYCVGNIQQLDATGGLVNNSSTISSGTIDLAFVDNSSTGINNVIDASGLPASAVIDSIVVNFNITHTWDSDVEINLGAPNGQIINLLGDIGASGDNFVNTSISSDVALPNVSTGIVPFTGTYSAQGLSTGLIGLPAVTTSTFSDLFTSPSGNWTIYAFDDAGGDVGTLHNWSIKFYYKSSSDFIWSPMTNLYTDAAATVPYTGTSETTVYTNTAVDAVYTVTATTGLGCTNTGTSTLTVNPLPTITLTSPATVAICEGGNTDITMTLTGTAPWTWVGDDGSGPATFNATSSPVVSNVAPTVPTTYSMISVTDANGCSNTSTESVTVSINPLPTMTLTSSPSVSICLGESTNMTFDLTGTAPWTWVGDDGSGQGTFTENSTPATANVSPTTTTTYSVVSITDATGCSNTSTASVVVNVNIPAAVTVTENNNILSSDATTGNQWYEQTIGILTGETNQDYTPTANGNYYVIVTDGNGCTTMSNVISFVLSSSNITFNSGLNIYPNPAKGKVFIEVSSKNNSMTTVELMTMDGRVLYESSTEVSGKVTMSINLDEYASGVYMIKAVSDNKTMIQKLVIQ